MTDRELLGLAAKAAGIEVIRSRLEQPLTNDFLVNGGRRNPHHEYGPWNPLTDDGDALRLAVKLRIDLRNFYPDEIAAQFKLSDRPGWGEASQERGTDPYAATRRAIVRAAAQIGENA